MCNFELKLKLFMRTFLIFLCLSFFGCTNKIQPIHKKPIDLKGNWVLNREIYEGDVLDYSENPVKHVLSFGEKRNFIIYSNIARFGLGENLEDNLTHGTGDYSIEENELLLKYEDAELVETFEIKEISDSKLVLINLDIDKEQHYVKKNDRNKS
jgi:hypothetical protein